MRLLLPGLVPLSLALALELTRSSRQTVEWLHCQPFAFFLFFSSPPRSLALCLALILSFDVLKYNGNNKRHRNSMRDFPPLGQRNTIERICSNNSQLTEAPERATVDGWANRFRSSSSSCSLLLCYLSLVFDNRIESATLFRRTTFVCIDFN